MASIDVVRKLRRSIRKGSRHEIRKWYEEANRITLPCFDDETPEAVKSDYLFCVLYKEIRFRQLLAGGSNLDAWQRLSSWCNFAEVFQMFHYQMKTAMKMPFQWLWDMTDGYVNQFQSFCQYRASATKTKRDVYILSQRHRCLSVDDALNRLNMMVECSNILQILELEKDGVIQLLTETEEEDVQIEWESSKTGCIVMGYFSLVALLRLHCLVGNYQAGLDILRSIDVNQQGFYTTLVISAHITTIYHYGFANLMLGRYVDALHGFNNILGYISKQPLQESPQILDKIEQMYALLAICLSLCPQLQLIDENVYSRLMKKYGEKLARMQRYDDVSIALYRELLSYAWPTFSTPFAPNDGDECKNYGEDGLVRCDDELSTVNHNQLEAVIVDMLKLKRKESLFLNVR